MAKSNFYKNKPDDKVWWLDDPDTTGEFVFSFDKQKKFNLFADYPHNLTPDQVKTFDAENPEWAAFFADRKQ